MFLLLTIIVPSLSSNKSFGDEVMALFDSIGEFSEGKESWSQYSESLEQFFAANNIPEAKKGHILVYHRSECLSHSGEFSLTEETF